jgi:hypothetical protein
MIDRAVYGTIVVTSVLVVYDGPGRTVKPGDGFSRREIMPTG